MSQSALEPKIVIGLGNPGKTYRYNRHNLGAMAVEALATQRRVSFQTVSRLYRWAIFQAPEMAGHCVLCLPETFMNQSGIAVRRILTDFQADSQSLLIVVDDIDLPLGRLRLRPKGSAGGHRGLASIIEQLGTANFARLRLGIGPQGINQPAEEFVLSDFRPAERELVDQIIAVATHCILDWATTDLRTVMNKYNALNLVTQVDAEA